MNLESQLPVGISQTCLFAIHHLFACPPTATGTLAKVKLQRLSIPMFQRTLRLFSVLGVGGEMPTKEQRGGKHCITQPHTTAVSERGDGSQKQRSKQKEEKCKAGKDILLCNSSSVGGWEKEKKRQLKTGRINLWLRQWTEAQGFMFKHSFALHSWTTFSKRPQVGWTEASGYLNTGS